MSDCPKDVGLPPTALTRTVATYKYNGLHWRTVKDADAKTPICLDQRRTMYYSAAWQILTEEVDDYVNTTGPHDTPSPNGVNHVTQQVWGPRSIDDPHDAVLRRLDRMGGTPNGLYSDEDDSQGTQRSFWRITDSTSPDETAVLDSGDWRGSAGPRTSRHRGRTTAFLPRRINAWVESPRPRRLRT